MISGVALPMVHMQPTHIFCTLVVHYHMIMLLFIKTNFYFYTCIQGLSEAAPLHQSRTAIGIVPLKNGQGDNLSPSKFREKTRKEAHTKRFISVQKLQAETERGKYILSHL